MALLGRAELYAAQLGMVAGTCCLCSLTGVASWLAFFRWRGWGTAVRARWQCLLVGHVASWSGSFLGSDGRR